MIRFRDISEGENEQLWKEDKRFPLESHDFLAVLRERKRKDRKPNYDDF